MPRIQLMIKGENQFLSSISLNNPQSVGMAEGQTFIEGSWKIFKNEKA